MQYKKISESVLYNMDKYMGTQNKQKKEGYVYIIKCGPYYKIGETKNINKRLAALQAGSPFKLRVLFYRLLNDTRNLEEALHFHYGEYRSRGEWFELPKDKLEECKEIIKIYAV